MGREVIFLIVKGVKNTYEKFYEQENNYYHYFFNTFDRDNCDAGLAEAYR